MDCTYSSQGEDPESEEYKFFCGSHKLPIDVGFSKYWLVCKDKQMECERFVDSLKRKLDSGRLKK
ncbi:MAG TPA: hypothetical protein VJ485_02985 [archaeon]|jgi:hypothetical protein|nr:hypothetical protein [archaeon]